MSMSRWHNSSCNEPDVFVEGDTPRCRACVGHCPWKELISRSGATSSLVPLPPDEPVGQMNLRWPPSVPYAKSERNREPGPSATSSAEGQFPGETKVESETSLPSPYRPGSDSGQPRQQDAIDPSVSIQLAEAVCSPIYGDTLASDEFRLACFSAVSDNSFPIHLSLETYSQDNCPEYETVSYTWGSEDGDSTLCQPIYIGPCWDLLLQTKNCWDMLRFIRPWRGIRMVWVDALCL